MLLWWCQVLPPKYEDLMLEESDGQQVSIVSPPPYNAVAAANSGHASTSNWALPLDCCNALPLFLEIGKTVGEFKDGRQIVVAFGSVGKMCIFFQQLLPRSFYRLGEKWISSWCLNFSGWTRLNCSTHRQWSVLVLPWTCARVYWTSPVRL